MRAHVLLVPALVAACGSGSPTDLSTENATIALGEYLVVNEQWGKGLAIGEHSQSIFLEQREGGPVFGWDWSWLGKAVVAYPCVFYGDSPFNGTRTTDQLPMPLGSRGITARFQVQTQATGTWDTSFDIFLTRTSDARIGSRTHEIMIWTEASHMVPAGEVVGRVDIGGVAWDVYYEPAIDVLAYGWPGTWVYVAYLAREPVRAGPLDLGAFLGDALARGYVPADAFLASISFGNEVVVGTGRTEVAGYALDLD